MGMAHRANAPCIVRAITMPALSGRGAKAPSEAFAADVRLRRTDPRLSEAKSTDHSVQPNISLAGVTEVAPEG